MLKEHYRILFIYIILAVIRKRIGSRQLVRKFINIFIIAQSKIIILENNKWQYTIKSDSII